jgi:hypothetical protein
MPRRSTSLWSILITFADLMEVANAGFQRLPGLWIAARPFHIALAMLAIYSAFLSYWISQ